MNRQAEEGASNLLPYIAGLFPLIWAHFLVLPMDVSDAGKALTFSQKGELIEHHLNVSTYPPLLWH
jgi:hypothetical protein